MRAVMLTILSGNFRSPMKRAGLGALPGLPLCTHLETSPAGAMCGLYIYEKSTVKFYAKTQKPPDFSEGLRPPLRWGRLQVRIEAGDSIGMSPIPMQSQLIRTSPSVRTQISSACRAVQIGCLASKRLAYVKQASQSVFKQMASYSFHFREKGRGSVFSENHSVNLRFFFWKTSEF